MMDILQAIAAENQPVQWTTPLGLPVLQPYFKAERHTVSATFLFKHAIWYTCNLKIGLGSHLGASGLGCQWGGFGQTRPFYKYGRPEPARCLFFFEKA